MPPFRKQGDEPLYPRVLWNRPVAKQAGGRLLIVGGHRTDFSLPTNLYQLASATGIGQATVVLPESLQRTLAGLPDIEFVPSSPSGSLGKAALGPILELASEHDVVLLAGIGNNSETAVLAESLVRQAKRPLVLTDDVPSALHDQLSLAVASPDNLLIVELPELFKIANTLGIPTSVSRTDLAGKLTVIQSTCGLLVMGGELIAASEADMVLTPAGQAVQTHVAAAAVASVFWAQNPSDHTAALATASFVLRVAAADRTRMSVPELAKALRHALDLY